MRVIIILMIILSFVSCGKKRTNRISRRSKPVLTIPVPRPVNHLTCTETTSWGQTVLNCVNTLTRRRCVYSYGLSCSKVCTPWEKDDDGI